MRHQYQAFKCAGCDYLTVDKAALSSRAKVSAPGQEGETLLAHTNVCLVQAVAAKLGLVVGDIDAREYEEPLPLPEDEPTRGALSHAEAS